MSNWYYHENYFIGRGFLQFPEESGQTVLLVSCLLTQPTHNTQPACFFLHNTNAGRNIPLLITESFFRPGPGFPAMPENCQLLPRRRQRLTAAGGAESALYIWPAFAKYLLQSKRCLPGK